jgi:hypothetical protein
LHSPYSAVSSNTIGSLISNMNLILDLPKGIWGAHSTRGKCNNVKRIRPKLGTGM